MLTKEQALICVWSIIKERCVDTESVSIIPGFLTQQLNSLSLNAKTEALQDIIDLAERGFSSKCTDFDSLDKHLVELKVVSSVQGWHIIDKNEKVYTISDVLNYGVNGLNGADISISLLTQWASHHICPRIRLTGKDALEIVSNLKFHSRHESTMSLNVVKYIIDIYKDQALHDMRMDVLLEANKEGLGKLSVDHPLVESMLNRVANVIEGDVYVWSLGGFDDDMELNAFTRWVTSKMQIEGNIV